MVWHPFIQQRVFVPRDFQVKAKEKLQGKVKKIKGCLAGSDRTIHVLQYLLYLLKHVYATFPTDQNLFAASKTHFVCNVVYIDTIRESI